MALKPRSMVRMCWLSALVQPVSRNGRGVMAANGPPDFTSRSAVACGSAQQKRYQVTLQLNWYHSAEFAGFYMAETKGFYREANIDPRIQEGGPGIPAREYIFDGRAHFAPKCKSVIWIFLVGGMSHLESFDPKPALTEFGGQEIGQTPHKDVLTAKFVNDNLRIVVPDDANGHIRHKLFPTQVGFKKHGQSGLDISDWWPHLATCADDLAIVRSMWTTDNNHGAQLQFHTGRHVLEGAFPTIGSWIHYGLGSLNDDLPQFVVLGTPIADCCGGMNGHGAGPLIGLWDYQDGVPGRGARAMTPASRRRCRTTTAAPPRQSTSAT